MLIGEATYRLVRHAVEVEPVEPLELKGKAERVPAYRLVSAREAESVERKHDSPLVGRARELAVLTDELAAAARDDSCRLVTIIAQAGVGKSRLIEEFVHAAQPNARVLKGRCLPYGRGITFWPLVEIVRDAAAIRDDDTPDEARAKLLQVAGRGGEDAVARVASAVGLGETAYPMDEVFWGTRKLLELQTARQPVVVVFEDIHWAESAFLDLIEHLKTTARAPLLLLCAARPDLLEYRPEWSELKGPLIELEPLSDEESELIVANLLGDAPFPVEVRSRIIASAEGNPLFVQQVLSMMIDDGLLRQEDGRWVPAGDLSDLAIPGTIQALLAARLDLLTPQERAVIEPASVIGLVFEEAAVADLAPDVVRPEVESHLVAMTQRQLVRPELDASDLDYRFHHILIRDAAYQGILKRARATMHERFVNWAEGVNRDRDRQAQFDEILGYHLEQAHQYLSELGPLDEHGLELGSRGSARLAIAGRRAFARGDMAAAANLLRRAAVLLPELDPARLDLLPDLGETMMEIGEFAWAEVYLEEALEGASKLGDERLRADALLTRLLVRHHATEDLGHWRAEVADVTGSLIPILEDRHAYPELAKAWRMVAFVHGLACQWEAVAEAEQHAIRYARLAGNARQEARLAAAYAIALCRGPTQVADAIERCTEILDRGLNHRQSEAMVRCLLALLHAMRGEFDRAREIYRTARPMLEDYGAVVLAAWTGWTSGRVELLAGNVDAAESELQRDYDQLLAIGELFFRPSVAVLLAQALFAHEKLDEAYELAEAAAAIAGEADLECQALLRSVKAKILVRRGSEREATELAREAFSLLAETDDIVVGVEVLLDLADVHRVAGDDTASAEALNAALELCRRKQMTVQTERLEAMLEALDPQSVTQQA